MEINEGNSNTLANIFANILQGHKYSNFLLLVVQALEISSAAVVISSDHQCPTWLSDDTFLMSFTASWIPQLL